MKKPKSLLLLMAISLGLTCASAFATSDGWDTSEKTVSTTEYDGVTPRSPVVVQTPAKTQSGGGKVGAGAPVNTPAPVITKTITREYTLEDGTVVNADGSKKGTKPTKSAVVKKPVASAKKSVAIAKKSAEKVAVTTKNVEVHKRTPITESPTAAQGSIGTKSTLPATESVSNTESPTVTKITPITEISSAVTKDTPETNGVSESKVLTSNVDSNPSKPQSKMIIIVLVLFAFCALLFINKLKHKIFTKQ